MLDQKKPFRKNKPLIILLFLFVGVTTLMSGMLIDLCLEAANEDSNAVISYAKAEEESKEDSTTNEEAQQEAGPEDTTGGWDFHEEEETGNWDILEKQEVQDLAEESEEPVMPPAQENTKESEEKGGSLHHRLQGGESDSYDPVVAESEKVKNDYFKDALFVGNSRTMGLQISAGVKGAEYITDIGMNVGVFFEREISYQGQTMTMADAVSLGEYKKVYLMFGINEVGWYDEDAFIRCYAKIIRYIKKVQPEAVIYVQSVIHCTKEKAEEDKIFGKKRVNEYNELLKKLAKKQRVYFVNVDEAVVNEKGILPSDASNDGIHLNYEYCKKWMNYLKTHTVSEGAVKSENEALTGEEYEEIPESDEDDENTGKDEDAAIDLKGENENA